MLDNLLNFNITTSGMTTNTVLTVLFTTLILGFVIANIYNYTHRYKIKTESMFLTLIMVPTVISVIILLIGTNIASAFSLSGAFALIRFRSAPGNPRDISYVFFTVAVGLASGLGYPTYALLFTIILSAVLIGIDVMDSRKKQSSGVMSLKITLPENITYQNRFDNTFKTFTKVAQFHSIKTTEYGSLYDVTYSVILKPDTDQKEFIDALRTLNSNLGILLTTKVISD